MEYLHEFIHPTSKGEFRMYSLAVVDVGLLVVYSYETLVSTYKPTRHYYPEDQYQHLHSSENLNLIYFSSCK
jgi:hypothetical protein